MTKQQLLKSKKAKTFKVEFKTLDQNNGVFDIALRFDTKTAVYNLAIFENGIEVNLPVWIFNGILETVKTNTSISSVVSVMNGEENPVQHPQLTEPKIIE